MRHHQLPVIILLSYTAAVTAAVGGWDATLPGKKDQTTMSTYQVVRFEDDLTIDGRWDKPEWQATEAVELTHFMGEEPAFPHRVQAKMMYNRQYLLVIFRVHDNYVRCQTQQVNGPVWEDSCVEFFFAPDTTYQERYFNLEVNCAGTPLMHYNAGPGGGYLPLDEEDARQIQIATSLPGTRDQEITTPTTWTLEYQIPVSLLKKYAPVTDPASGVQWRANFYKIAHKSSHPHYITWSPIERQEPDFHLPEFFGLLEFQ
ncbi:MAG: carbohydrate-binding family 9-like protein [Tunicatimonas sp.]